MIVSAHQPSLIPYIGYWNKVASSDLLLFMSYAQYSKGDYFNRVPYNGTWLTLPVFCKGKQSIYDTLVDIRALPKLLKTIKQTTSTAKYRHRIFGLLDYLDTTCMERLSEVNISLHNIVASELGIATKTLEVVRAYEGLGNLETTESRLFAMLKEQAPDMTTYLSGAGGRSYMASPQPNVLFQTVKDLGTKDSIISVLTKYQDPLDFILASCEWGNV